MSTVQRAVALGTAVALTAGSTILGASAAHAEESVLPGIDLPVPATDITDTDTDLGSVAREVVVVVDGPDGKPEVRKLRARTQAQAQELAIDLNAEPGVAASLNRPVKVPTVPSDAGASSTAEGSFALTPKASPKGVLAGEPSYQWGLYAVNAEGAWSVTRGRGVIVAVVDTGVDTGHPDLAGQVLTQIDLVGDGATGDPVGHGTHVAGIVAATLDRAGTTGLAPQVKVLPVRVLGEDGGDDSTVANGIIRAVDAGAKVINLSLGSEQDPPAVHSAVQYALGRGVTVVAAAGNDGPGGPVNYPAATDGVIGVGAFTSSWQRAGFSSTGDWIDISAPGQNILSTLPDGDWGVMSGTSMATPFVAAAAALVRAANLTLTKAQVDKVLLSTARDDADGDGRDPWFGAGYLQADKATLKAAQAPWGLRAPAAKVSVAKVGYGNQLRVNVDPDKGSGYWSFRVQKRTTNGSWSTIPTAYTTTGTTETKTITLGKGTYRAVVAANHGYRGATSAAVTLTAPTVKVRTSTDSSKDKLRVDVDPNKGSGYWTFKVQKRSATGAWTTLSTTYRTEGSAETKTLNLGRGTYRVVVAGKYGYLGNTSARVYLTR